MRRLLYRGSIAVAVLSVIGLIVSFPVEASYRGKATLIQRVQIDDAAASLFGDEPTPIGSPQLMIIEDPGAFVEGTGPQGARMVNDAYLGSKGIYPLQLKTVEFSAGLSRIGFVIATLVAAVAFGLSRPRSH